jgi:hypothetical protein
MASNRDTTGVYQEWRIRMNKCLICNKRLSDGLSWCNDCQNECEDLTDLAEIAEWAANRARDFEKEKAKVLIEALEKILNKEMALVDDNWCYESYCKFRAIKEALEEYKKEE